MVRGGIVGTVGSILILPLDSSRDPNESYIVVEVHYRYENCCTGFSELFLNENRIVGNCSLKLPIPDHIYLNPGRSFEFLDQSIQAR